MDNTIQPKKSIAENATIVKKKGDTMNIKFSRKEMKTQTIEISAFSHAYMIAMKTQNPKLWTQFILFINSIDEEVAQ